MNQRIPEVIRVLAAGGMSSPKQHQFASLLIDLGELLHHHADSHTHPAAESRRATLAVELPVPNREDTPDDS
ncbi:hypothetical protein [Amycolatopsis minnesotensis]|uniref:hypothetical protein n=1 Tax=Amycolatopsis minnesotensis TaxID=337894 RepID=UPI0031E42F3B